ncbi:probable WRKY transcription factor 10 [Raphanus sativus]|uniref:Probable WRKY transcription factor 10 n=1 Tax=Raphanus sativus TaxID=3726 RepID=A0A6J0KNI3_RAPSA|nr:probable WRKY transcription factor 10 [Raphanus sativus]
MSDYNQNDNGINPISETSSQTNLRTDPQSERRSGSTVERVSARIGRDIPTLNMECLRPFSNSFRTPNLVHSLIRVASPRFNTLCPSLQSPNMFTNSSSQIIHPIPIPNDATQEMVESSGGAHATMMISNKNPPHQPTDVDLPPQKGADDIPTEQSVDITSLESNADPIGAPLLLSFDSTVVAEMDAMNLISLKSESEDDDKDK